jgi:hypothetical protein
MRYAPVLLLLMACRAVTAPCATETRQVARVAPWSVVCLEPSGGTQLCAVFPTPPPAPDWVGDPSQMAAHGYPLHDVTVCRDTRITDTPI